MNITVQFSTMKDIRIGVRRTSLLVFAFLMARQINVIFLLHFPMLVSHRVGKYSINMPGRTWIIISKVSFAIANPWSKEIGWHKRNFLWRWQYVLANMNMKYLEIKWYYNFLQNILLRNFTKSRWAENNMKLNFLDINCKNILRIC